MGDWERHQAAAEERETGERLMQLRDELVWLIAEGMPALKPEAKPLLDMINAQLAGRPQGRAEPDDDELVIMALERNEAASSPRMAGYTIAELEHATGITERSALIIALNQLRNEERVKQVYDGHVGQVRWQLIRPRA